ncbi:MAG: ABC transporter permease subunit, partial [Carnobacterium sp.]
MSGFDIFFDGNNLIRLFQGLLVVVKLSVISLILGLILGVVLGILRTTSFKVVLKIYLEIFRVVPLLVLLFVFYYIVPELLNSEVSNQVVSISVFILWISAEMSDLVRSGIENVPVQQIEIGKSLGFNSWQQYYYILLPQGVIPVIPGVINLVTRVIKTTSL